MRQLGAPHRDKAVPVLVVVHLHVLRVKLGLALPVLEAVDLFVFVGLLNQAGVLLVDLAQMVPAKGLERRLPEPLEPVEPGPARHLVQEPGEPVGEPVVVVLVRRVNHAAPVGSLQKLQRLVRYVGRPIWGMFVCVVA